ncbi:hypothetical protein vBKpnAMK4_00109 [Klebsiella phage vB_Kpn_AM_K4]
MFNFTQKKFDNTDIVVYTLWEGENWCSAAALKPSDRTPENIAKVKASMLRAAKRPGAPRNGKR